MKTLIRPMVSSDRDSVLDMMRVFYASPAVLSNGSEGIFSQDFEACVSDSPYLEGYIFEDGYQIQGYAMVAKSFSTEFGKPCIWIEDLYLREEFRGNGIGSAFLQEIGARYPNALLRLEVEPENERAVHTYEKCGFSPLPYLEMMK